MAREDEELVLEWYARFPQGMVWGMTLIHARVKKQGIKIYERRKTISGINDLGLRRETGFNGGLLGTYS